MQWIGVIGLVMTFLPLTKRPKRLRRVAGNGGTLILRVEDEQLDQDNVYVIAYALVLVNGGDDCHERQDVMLKTLSVILMHPKVDDDESFHVPLPRNLCVTLVAVMLLLRRGRGGGGGGGGGGSRRF